MTAPKAPVESPWNPFFLERLCQLCAYRLVQAVESPEISSLVGELAQGNVDGFRAALKEMNLPPEFIPTDDNDLRAFFSDESVTRKMAHLGALILARAVMPLWLDLIYEAVPKDHKRESFEFPFDERFLPEDPERVERFFRALEPIPREQVLRAIRELCMATPTHFPEDVSMLLTERFSR